MLIFIKMRSLFLLFFWCSVVILGSAVDPSNVDLTLRQQHVGIAADEKPCPEKVCTLTLTCMGTILTPEWILTSANCLKQFNGTLRIYYNLMKKTEVTTEQAHKKVDERHVFKMDGNNSDVKPPEGYLQHDVALLQINSSSKFDVKLDPVQIVKLPEINYTPGLKGTILRQKNDTLETVQLTTLESSKCEWSKQSKFVLCVETADMGPCPGTAGGGLLGNDTLWGMVPYVNNEKICDEKNQSSAYMVNIFAYLDWIKNITKTEVKSTVAVKVAETTTLKSAEPEISSAEEFNDSCDPNNRTCILFRVRHIEGTPANDDQFPYHVGLTAPTDIHCTENASICTETLVCAGTLIGDGWVVTSIHCVENVSEEGQPPRGRVYIGSLSEKKVSTLENYSTIRMVVKFNATKGEQEGNATTVETPGEDNSTAVPEKYTPNDIALIALTNANFSNDTVGIPTAEYTSDDNCTVTGWGQAVDTANVSAAGDEILVYTEVRVLKANECDWSRTNEHLICVKTLKNGACLADVGAGLVCDGVLVGVTPMVREPFCNQSDGPVYFTSVYGYSHWIRQQMLMNLNVNSKGLSFEADERNGPVPGAFNLKMEPDSAATRFVGDGAFLVVFVVCVFINILILCP